MGNLCACATAKRTERTLNHSPEEKIQQDSKKSSEKRKNEEFVRFFMTGLGSAGKTTIIRQLQLLCNQNANYKMCDEDWNEVGKKSTANAQMEDRTWARQIRRNVIDIFDLLIKHINTAEDKGEMAGFATEENREFAFEIEEICEEGNWDELDTDLERFRAGLMTLLDDKAIKEAYGHRNKIYIEGGKKLFDGCDYFLQRARIHEIFSDNYTPSDEAKVHSRNPTVDMSTYRFKLNATRIEITDVGGQRSELIKIVDYLRNWSFNCNDQCHNFILLVISMSDYNVRHQQYEGTLLDECVEYMKVASNFSINATLRHVCFTPQCLVQKNIKISNCFLYPSVCTFLFQLSVLMNNKIAQNCGLLIFFNKKDRFREKLADPFCRHDIGYLAPFLTSKFSKDYLSKGKFDERQMGDALSRKFVEAIRQMEDRQKDTYCRFTCAIDSKMMEGIFGAIKDDILNENILKVFP